MIWRADIHIHSCLSPCGGLEMAPAAITHAARAAGLNAIALTDHNSSRNLPAFAQACRRAGLAALFGIEVTTSEELHALCLFDRSDTATAFGEAIYARLPPIINRPEKMGDQVVVDIDENILEHIPLFLGGATNTPLTDLAEQVGAAGGLFIPSHIDRNSFSLMSQLGAIPDIPCDAMEVTSACPQAVWRSAIARSPALIYASDAHYLKDIGRRYIELDCDQFDIPGIRRALPDCKRRVTGR